MRPLKSLFVAAAVFVAGLTSQAQSDIRQGLVSYWPLEANNGGTVSDLGVGNNLNIAGSPTAVTGFSGNGFRFNATTDHLNLPHTIDNTATGLPVYSGTNGAHTVMFWVNVPTPPAGTGDKTIFGERGGANPIFFLGLRNAGSDTNSRSKLDVFVRNNAGGATPSLNHRKTTSVVFDGTWHHVAWVDNKGAAKVYIDGVLDATDFTYNPGGVFSLDRTAIGALVQNTGTATQVFTNGIVDEVGIWERALTQDEVNFVRTNHLSSVILPASLPFISVTKTNFSLYLGTNVTLNPRAVGNPPFTYQWQKNGVDLGLNANVLTLSNVTTNDSGVYTFSAANANGTATQNFIIDVLPDPSISGQPISTNVMTGATVNFSVAVSGTPPYSYAWTKDGAPVGSDANPLILTNVQLSDAGQYRVTVSNSLGTALSEAATLTVVQRPDPTATLAVDFNHRGTNDAPEYTETGFQSFTLDGTGDSAISTPTSRSFGGIDVTISGAGVTTSSRLRNQPLDSGSFTQSKLLRDFVFAANGTNQGLDCRIQFLKPNEVYRVTVWSFDQSNSGNRVSDWYANGQLVKESYIFNGSVLPTSNDDYKFTFQIQSSATGEILLEGRQSPLGPGPSVFLNAIRLEDSTVAFPPSLLVHPQDVNTYVAATVGLSVAAEGTPPLSYTWKKGTDIIAGATSSTLVLTNVQLSDSGVYHVIVSNGAGSITSSNATVTVSARPTPPPSDIKIDINNNGSETEVDTEPGFISYTLSGIGLNTRTLSNGVDVSISGAGGTLIQSRKRTGPVNTGNFTQEKLLRDMIFSTDNNTSQGIDIEVAYLKPNQPYTVSVWSYDRESNLGGNRISDWYANGQLVRQSYSFTGGAVPTSNEQYRIDFSATADATGKIAIQVRRSALATTDINCFINGLQLVEMPGLVISDIRPISSNVQLSILTSDTARPHRIDETVSLSPPGWAPVAGVVFNAPGGNVLQAQFPAPSSNRFYRAVMLAPAGAFSDDFENGTNGWIHGGTGDSWALGTPTGGPGAAHSPVNCWGTGLGTPYANNTQQWLRSPVINLTNVASAKLEFWEYRDVEPLFGGNPTDYTEVRIKDAANPDGAPLVTLAQNVGSQTQWTKRSFILGSEALGKSIIVEFFLLTDDFQPSPQTGWFIDDVVIVP